jgi:hypothetical protein
MQKHASVWAFEVAEAGKESNRARVLTRMMVVILVLAVNVVCIMAVLSLVEAGTAIPDIYMADFSPTDNSVNGTAYVSVVGSVANPSSLTANNVTVVVRVYVYYHVPPLNTALIDLGSIPGNSSKRFNTDVQYSSGWQYRYADYDLLLNSRFDFGPGFYAIVLPMAVLLPTLNIYSAYQLGLFGWIRARKRVVSATFAWSVVIAFMIILSYWLFYSSPGRGSWESPELYVWGWVSIFLMSIVAGAIIADLETVVYSFVACVVLSLVFEVIYACFFGWFILGSGEAFSYTIPGLAFMTFFESVIAGQFVIILRMTNFIVPCFCLLGVFIGLIVRSYYEPSVDSY